MAKGASSVTDSLYKISDKIAQASKEKNVEPGKIIQPVQSVNHAPVKKQLSAERILEFNRMHHDLEIRVESMLAEYSEEQKIIETRMNELQQSSEQIRKMKQELAEITLPDSADEDPELALSKQMRSLELMRLESIRMNKKMDAGKNMASAPAAVSNNAPDLMNIPDGEIMKKGFAFFFPLALALIFCTIIMGLAFIVAWKVAL